MASRSLPDLSAMTTSQALDNLASAWPTPTNAQALAVLEALPQWASADEAIAAGLPEQTARAYLAPDGVLPRMRLLASSWEKPGGKYAAAGLPWWGQAYKYPLWAGVSRYAADVDALGDHHMVLDEDVANRDAAAVSHVLATVEQVDAPPVFAAPCPKWIIPPTRGALPTPNPDCLRQELEKNKDKLPLPIMPVKRNDNVFGLLLIVAVGYLVLRKGKSWL